MPKQESPLKFIRLSNLGCRYHFELLTSHVCPTNKIVTKNDCKLNDPSIDVDIDFTNNFNSFTYDFSKLDAQPRVEVSLDKDKGLKFGVCKAVDQDISSCLFTNASTTSCQNLGKLSRQIEQNNGLLSLLYAQGDNKCSTKIEFFCDYNEERSQANYLYYSANRCQHVIAYYTYLACAPYLTRQNIDFDCGNASSIGESIFRLKLGTFNLAFRVCGLLPDAKQFEIGQTYYGACFDQFGFAYGSACLYDEFKVGIFFILIPHFIQSFVFDKII